jgi:hypothetical protein
MEIIELATFTLIKKEKGQGMDKTRKPFLSLGCRMGTEKR